MELISPDILTLTARALQDRLKSVLPEGQFQHAFLPARLDAGVWKQLVTRTPFVGLGWSTLDHDQGARSFTGYSQWIVFLVVKNPGSGFAPRYLGDAQSQGLFAVTCAAVAVLHGMTIDGVGTVSVRSAGNSFAEGYDPEHGAMAALEVRVGARLTVASSFTGLGATPDALTELTTTWNFDGIVVDDVTTRSGT